METVLDAIESLVTDVSACTELIARAADLARRWPRLAPAEKRTILMSLVERIGLLRATLEIRILPGRLLSVLGEEDAPQNWRRRAEAKEPTIAFTIPARLRRTGKETRLLIDGAGGGARRTPDHSLCRILAQAYRYNKMVMRNDGKTMAELAAEAGVGGSYFSRILRLSFLAPEVVKAILRDGHPIELTAKRLANGIHLPIAWDEQGALLGTG